MSPAGSHMDQPRERRELSRTGGGGVGSHRVGGVETRTIRIGWRFRGPEKSGNGGYSAGLVGTALAAAADGAAVQVTLRKPPPLDFDLALDIEPPTDGVRTAVLTAADEVVAAGRTVADEELAEVAEMVTVDRALAAEAAYQGLQDHPFPSCFTCGPANAGGLRLRPGRYGEGRTACTWSPAAGLAGADGLVDPVYVWAALDCPGGWTADIAGRPMVLGRLTAKVDERPTAGETYVVTGLLLGGEGRKTQTVATLYAADGRPLAHAKHTWIAVDPAAFNENLA
jgi:hypothetical protein